MFFNIIELYYNILHIFLCIKCALVVILDTILSIYKVLFKKVQNQYKNMYENKPKNSLKIAEIKSISVYFNF